MIPKIDGEETALQLAITGETHQPSMCTVLVMCIHDSYPIPSLPAPPYPNLPIHTSIGILKDHIMDEYLIADYLLFTLNQHGQFQ